MARMGFIQDEMDLKLLVLYIMARIAAPITFLQLLELALCDAGVDYFSLTQAVEHLVETEHLSREGERYAITEKGRRNSEICESSLPYSVRRRCDDNLVRVNETLMREQQVQGEVLPNPDGTCTVRLRLADDSGPLLELSLLMPAAGQGSGGRPLQTGAGAALPPAGPAAQRPGGAGEDAVRLQRPGTREKNPVKHILGFSFCIYMYIMDLDEKSEPRRRGPERKIGTEGPSDGGITQ